MSDCCSSSLCSTGKSVPKKHRCPKNGNEYLQVSTTTIMHHIDEPWNWKIKEQGYYFCDDPMCEIVYFGEDGIVIEKSALRKPVGIKEKTKEQVCACDVRNPSGKCCLKDFPKDID